MSSKHFSAEYRRKEWRYFRELVLEHSNYCCQDCGRHRDEAILQVHHRGYIKDKKPWEYPPETCVALCRRCHAEIHGKIPPDYGWQIIDSDLDHGVPSGETACARCDSEIRWHVTMYHNDWGEMVVGSTCAEKLSMDKEVRDWLRRSGRISRFIKSKRWSKHEGICESIKERGHTIDVILGPAPLGFYLVIDQEKGDLTFSTITEAKVRAFEVVEAREGAKTATAMWKTFR